MKSPIIVADRPLKPLMIYDGDCHFCVRGIRYWKRATGDYVDYTASQDPSIHARFPEIPQKEFDTSVQLITLDGLVHNGAEAVFRSLACANRARWMLNWYQHSRVFAGITEWGYHFIARHRPFFSAITFSR
jgi:predicted DCC family thiol-disulfide oxidoreductase YuxK